MYAIRSYYVFEVGTTDQPVTSVATGTIARFHRLVNDILAIELLVLAVAIETGLATFFRSRPGGASLQQGDQQER